MQFLTDGFITDVQASSGQSWKTRTDACGRTAPFGIPVADGPKDNKSMNFCGFLWISHPFHREMVVFGAFWSLKSSDGPWYSQDGYSCATPGAGQVSDRNLGTTPEAPKGSNKSVPRCLVAVIEVLDMKRVPSGNVKIAMENGHL